MKMMIFLNISQIEYQDKELHSNAAFMINDINKFLELKNELNNNSHTDLNIESLYSANTFFSLSHP